MEDSIDQGSYYKDRQSGKIFTFSAILAIILACLGLFGLSSFTAQQRIREIGIRKVFGASVSKILSLLSMNFARLVLYANLIAWPIGYYVMEKWLTNFAYRTDINFRIFILSSLLSILISVITISYKSIHASLANPIDTLKYE